MKSKGTTPVQSKKSKLEPIVSKEQLVNSKLVNENMNFTPDQINEIYDVFECFANPLTKRLKMKDFVESLKIYGYITTQNHIMRTMTLINSENEDPITFEEFLTKLSEKIGHPSSVQGREAIFNMIDAEKKEYITMDDLKNLADQVGLNLNERDLREIYLTFKKKKDNEGKDSEGITFDEFEKYLVSRQNIVIPTSKKRITELN